MIARKVKLKLNRKQIKDINEISFKSAHLYNVVLNKNFELVDNGQFAMTAFDMMTYIREFKIGDGIGSDVVGQICIRISQAIKRWLESDRIKLKFWLQHGQNYLKPLKAYLAKAGKLWGKPRFKNGKGISLQFIVRKTDQRRIHRKIARRRKHSHHVMAKTLCKAANNIYVGNLNIRFLFAGRLARSASDAAHSQFLSILSYKAENAGKIVKIVNEAYTSQTCYNCNARRKISLSEREFFCPHCNYSNNRDVNSALNILSVGERQRLELCSKPSL